MRKLVFLDLDDTLFQSRRKCPSEPDLHPVAYLRDGSSHSFMTAKQRAFWGLLSGNATVVPTTARDLDALRRVDLPFESWRILVYGGLILEPSGRPDEVWLTRMRGVCAAAIEDLRPLLETAGAFIDRHGLAVRVRLVEDLGLPFYFVAKYQDQHENDLATLQRELVEPWIGQHSGAYRLHRNGNNLAVIPSGIGKEHAVRYLIDRLAADGEPLLTFGIGDSLVDGAFMANCDYCITPRGTQLFDETFARVLM